MPTRSILIYIPGATVDSTHPLWALLMALDHQRIHVETSSVLFREMPLALLQASAHLPPPHPVRSVIY
jgi:hypothetical protein